MHSSRASFQKSCGSLLLHMKRPLAALSPLLLWDIKDLVTCAPAADGMLIKVPVLNVLLMQAKLGPWHTLRLKVWQAITVDPGPLVHSHRRTHPHAAEAELAHTGRVAKGMARRSSLHSQFAHLERAQSGHPIPFRLCGHVLETGCPRSRGPSRLGLDGQHACMGQL